MTRFFLALIALGASLLLTSCADTETKSNEQGGVSSIPWNRPEKWEGQGMMPGIQAHY